MSEAWVRFFATFFGVGRFPFAPGTCGSLAALAIAWSWPGAVLPGAVLASAAGLALCAPARRAFRADDPSAFVLDEVAGMWISLAGVPHAWPWYLAAFLAFRALDVWKPGPIGAVQRSSNPLSIMGDDILAGAFVCTVLQLVVRTR